MRIDVFNSTAAQIANDPGAQQVNSSGAAKLSHSDTQDRATLSSDSVSLNSLVATALQTPNVRHDKVEALRHAVSSGQYQLDATGIAASILDEHA